MSYPITVTSGQVRFLLNIFYWNFAFYSFDENKRSLGFKSCFFAGEIFLRLLVVVHLDRPLRSMTHVMLANKEYQTTFHPRTRQYFPAAKIPPRAAFQVRLKTMRKEEAPNRRIQSLLILKAIRNFERMRL